MKKEIHMSYPQDDFSSVYKIHGNDKIGYVHVQRTYDDDDATVDYTLFDHNKRLYDGGQLDIDLTKNQNLDSLVDDIVGNIMEEYGYERLELVEACVYDLEELGFTGM